MAFTLPFYLFTGPEFGEKNDTLQEIRNKTEKKFGQFDFYTFYASETKLSEIMAILTNGSLFSPARFVVIKNAEVIIKGLRTVADFEYEFQMALLNKALNPEFETMFMMTNSMYSYISSSMVTSVAKYDGALEGLVPEINIPEIRRKYSK